MVLSSELLHANGDIQVQNAIFTMVCLKDIKNDRVLREKHTVSGEENDHFVVKETHLLSQESRTSPDGGVLAKVQLSLAYRRDCFLFLNKTKT